MKRMIILVIIVCTLFTSLSTAVFASAKNIDTVTSSSSNVIVHYSDLKVGYTISLIGNSLTVVSGSAYVTTSGMLVTGKAPGNAVVYAYKNGALYSIQYITVIR